jgi:hypothetical protein
LIQNWQHGDDETLSSIAGSWNIVNISIQQTHFASVEDLCMTGT